MSKNGGQGLEIVVLGLSDNGRKRQVIVENGSKQSLVAENGNSGCSSIVCSLSMVPLSLLLFTILYLGCVNGVLVV